MTTSSPGPLHRAPSCSARRKRLQPFDTTRGAPAHAGASPFYRGVIMDVRDITAENVARAVGGTVERDGSILCRCPVHEASGTHNPSLVLTITDTRRILFHCRSQNCDAKHFQAIRDHLVKCGLPRSHVGGDRADKEDRYTYQHL